jgi:hypothetical protein
MFLLPASSIVAINNRIFFDAENSVNTSNGVTTKEDAEWVLMFYQCGDNSISSAIGVCLYLIGKIGATNDVKIAVLIDKKPLNDTKLYYYEGKTPVQQEWPFESDLSDSDTLVMFAEKVMNDYPATHYCLAITANKGSGWQGICYDEHGDEIMITMPELFEALDDITENGCLKLDVFLLQSCLGGNLELRYQIHQFCQYFVGYADCGLVGDIPFDEILAEVVADPSMDAERFATMVVDHFTPQQIQQIYQALGATDATKLDALAESIDDLAELLVHNIEDYRSDIESALEITRRYGLQFDIDYFVDLKDFLDHLFIDDTEFFDIKNMVLTCIEEAVVAKVTLEGYPSCGFNFYFPDEKNEYNDALRYDHALPSPYEKTLFSADTQWDEFLKEYLNLSSNMPPSTPDIDGPNKGRTNEVYDCLLSADDNQGDDVSFYIDWGDSTYEMDGPVSSGEKLSINHTWKSDGKYVIKVKAIDQYGAESDWAALELSMPKNKIINIDLSILQFLKTHLYLFPILRQIISFLG